MKDCIEQIIRELFRPFRSYEKKKFYTRGAYSMSLKSLMSADEGTTKPKSRSKKSKTKSLKSKKKKSSKLKTAKADKNCELKKCKENFKLLNISEKKPMLNKFESVSTLGRLFDQDFTPNVKIKKPKKEKKTKKEKKEKKFKDVEKEEDYSLLLKEYECSTLEKKPDDNIITPFDDKSLSDHLIFPLSEYFSPNNKSDQRDISAEEDILKKEKKSKKSKKKINLKIKDMKCQEDSSDFNAIGEKVSMGLKEYLNNIK